MKIAHITSLHPQNDNRIFYKECKTLSKTGYDITLICAGADTEDIDNIKIVGYPKVDRGRINRILKTSFVDMLKICKKIDVDIYHFHDPELIFVGLYLKLMGKKVIYDIHENNPASILSKPYIKSRLIKRVISKAFDIFEKTAINFFDAIVTARPDISKRFKHKRLVTLRNFPILPDFSKLKTIDIKKEKPAVIFVGGMTDIRGINQLLDAFELLEHIELWLLGPINEKKLKHRIQKGCKNVRYFGMVEAFEVFSYIQKADIGIITFLPLPNHLQTLATKPFEYMACGKPMVMSNFPYWQETFKESSLYVDPLNPKEIAFVINKLIQNIDLMKKMSKINIQLSKQEYNWEIESKKLIDLYEDLI